MRKQSASAAADTPRVERRIATIAALLLALTALGTVGFRIVSGSRWFDCLYMAVITLTTVGYGEVIPLDDAGRMFVMVYLGISIGIFTYTVFSLGQLLVSGEWQLRLEQRHMKQRIQELQGHYIVCGLGRMGLAICRQLHERHQSFVAIDHDAEKLSDVCRQENWLRVSGDATDDQVLHQAGIDRARALATVLPTDADNIYVILSARMLSSHLEIVSRASNDKASAKMERAGANRVVSPFSAGALKIARFLLHPNVEDFLDIADRQGHSLELVDVQITADSPVAGKELQNTDLSRLGVLVVGMRRANGEQLMSPGSGTIIQPGDCLFAFGHRDVVNRVIAELGNQH